MYVTNTIKEKEAVNLRVGAHRRGSREVTWEGLEKGKAGGCDAILLQLKTFLQRINDKVYVEISIHAHT